MAQRLGTKNVVSEPHHWQHLGILKIYNLRPCLWPTDSESAFEPIPRQVQHMLHAQSQHITVLRTLSHASWPLRQIVCTGPSGHLLTSPPITQIFINQSVMSKWRDMQSCHVPIRTRMWKNILKMKPWKASRFPRFSYPPPTIVRLGT